MTIKVIDGHKNISGGDVIQSFKPKKPKRNIQDQLAYQAASANTLTLPKISENDNDPDDSTTTMRDLKRDLSKKYYKYQSLAYGGPGNEYFQFSPRTDQTEPRKQRNLTSLETQKIKHKALFSLGGGQSKPSGVLSQQATHKTLNSVNTGSKSFHR